ncbi:hypothetical protein [Streptomyces sp. NPDC092370]|uniref:hypothetical protein n=1 Tax=Streptomyces sp. NPDC092370 TaxID=3366016 RepID=UPI00382839EF
MHYEETSLYWDLHSRQEVREIFGPWFSYAALHAELVDGIETGQRAAVQWRFSGEIRAALPGVWPAQAIGRQFSDATGNVLGLVDDAGKRTHTYANANGPTGLPRGTTTETIPHGPVTEPPRHVVPLVGGRCSVLQLAACCRALIHSCSLPRLRTWRLPANRTRRRKIPHVG